MIALSLELPLVGGGLGDAIFRGFGSGFVRSSASGSCNFTSKINIIIPVTVLSI